MFTRVREVATQARGHRGSLSEHLDRVEQGVEIVVTRRGRRVARLSAIGRDEALAELVRRGLVRLPERPRSRALRGYDAVHLASALALGPGDTILATWDRDLCNAAVDAGLAVAPVL